MGTQPTWTTEQVEQLTQMWKKGVPTPEIGRRIGLSKNAVIGKAYRIGLMSRLVKESPPPRRNVFDFIGPACMWPLGHPSDDDFHFCGRRPLPDKPYCADHASLAYIRPGQSTYRRALKYFEYLAGRRSARREAA